MSRKYLYLLAVLLCAGCADFRADIARYKREPCERMLKMAKSSTDTLVVMSAKPAANPYSETCLELMR